jgi:FkbM family methyltransferase
MIVHYAGHSLAFEHADPLDHIARHHAAGYVYEKALLDHLRSLPEVRGRYAVDVGAHVGNHSAALLAGGEVAGVLAFEPTERYRALCAALRHVDPLGSRWLAMRRPAGNGETVELVDAPPGNSGMARVRVSDSGLVTVRLDDIVKVDVGLVKIDVEGHEIHVLQGARTLLRSCRPALAVEGDLDMIAAAVEPLGYVWEGTWNATPTHVFRHAEVMG